MGGRGASSGLDNGFLRVLIRRMQMQQAATAGGDDPGDYTDDGNPALVKYQGQEDDKTARFLAKVWNDTDLAAEDDGYGFYDNSYQKLALSLGLNKGPTVLSEGDFNQYVQQTNAQVFYRGWSSRNSADRLLNAPKTHTGTGLYGDGIYMTTDKGTAASYGSAAVTTLALSPTARVVNLSTVRARIQQSSQRLQTGLNRAGSVGQRSYGANNGEAQMALKMGYNVVRIDTHGGSYYYALTRDALVVSKKY